MESSPGWEVLIVSSLSSLTHSSCLFLQANPFANVDEKEDMEAYQKQVEDRKLQEQGETEDVGLW